MLSNPPDYDLTQLSRMLLWNRGQKSAGISKLTALIVIWFVSIVAEKHNLFITPSMDVSLLLIFCSTACCSVHRSPRRVSGRWIMCVETVHMAFSSIHTEYCGRAQISHKSSVFKYKTIATSSLHYTRSVVFSGDFVTFETNFCNWWLNE